MKLVKKILEEIVTNKKKLVDFVLYIGEVKNNEPVYTFLNNIQKKNNKLLS